MAVVRAVYHSNRKVTYPGVYRLEVKPSMFRIRNVRREEQERLVGEAVLDLPGPVVQVRIFIFIMSVMASHARLLAEG